MKELDTLEAFADHLSRYDDLTEVVCIALDLREHGDLLQKHALTGSVFLGCELDEVGLLAAREQGALVFPQVPNLPYRAFRSELYQVEELYAGFDRHRPESHKETLDMKVYGHFKMRGGDRPRDFLEALSQRLHDLCMTDAVDALLESEQADRPVAIMGGHSAARSSADYAQVAKLARTLTQRGFFLISGGGPGAMEATHLGAWFAARPEGELDEALAILAPAPTYEHPAWLSTAFEVRERFPLSDDARVRFPSLGIPTWLYGHEPPNVFATHVAKYFANSIREDGLVTLARHGIVFSPGSAGTIQEIFQDACQNHYNTMGVVSPMIFLGSSHWGWRRPVFPLLSQLAAGREYASSIYLTDSNEEIVEILEAFEPAP